MKRDFTPEAPDRLWVADITYVRSWEGWLYLSFRLRQLHGRELRLDLEAGVDSPALMAEPSDNEDGDLRVYRDVLQPEKETFGAGQSEPLRVRRG